MKQITDFTFCCILEKKHLYTACVWTPSVSACVFCSCLSCSPVFSRPSWLWMHLLPAAHSLLPFVFAQLLMLSDMVVHNSASLVSPLLLLLLQFSKAQCSELIQPVCLIAFHFQEASLLAPTERFIHQMIGLSLLKCYCRLSFGAEFCTLLLKNNPLSQNDLILQSLMTLN